MTATVAPRQNDTWWMGFSTGIALGFSTTTLALYLAGRHVNTIDGYFALALGVLALALGVLAISLITLFWHSFLHRNRGEQA